MLSSVNKNVSKVRRSLLISQIQHSSRYLDESFDLNNYAAAGSEIEKDVSILIGSLCEPSVPDSKKDGKQYF